MYSTTNTMKIIYFSDNNELISIYKTQQKQECYISSCMSSYQDTADTYKICKIISYLHFLHSIELAQVASAIYSAVLQCCRGGVTVTWAGLQSSCAAPPTWPSPRHGRDTAMGQQEQSTEQITITIKAISLIKLSGNKHAWLLPCHHDDD